MARYLVPARLPDGRRVALQPVVFHRRRVHALLAGRSHVHRHATYVYLLGLSLRLLHSRTTPQIKGLRWLVQ